MGLLEELAVRCEAATGADRELDCLIWAEVTEQKVVWTGGDGHLLVIGDSAIGSIDPGKHSRNFSCSRAASGPGSIPAYTASTDAAMTLLDDQCGYEQRRASEGSKDYWATIWWVPDFPGKVHATGRNPALALTAASLRARHALALSEG